MDKLSSLMKSYFSSLRLLVMLATAEVSDFSQFEACLLCISAYFYTLFFTPVLSAVKSSVIIAIIITNTSENSTLNAQTQWRYHGI